MLSTYDIRREYNRTVGILGLYGLPSHIIYLNASILTALVRADFEDTNSGARAHYLNRAMCKVDQLADSIMVHMIKNDL